MTNEVFERGKSMMILFTDKPQEEGIQTIPVEVKGGNEGGEEFQMSCQEDLKGAPTHCQCGREMGMRLYIPGLRSPSTAQMDFICPPCEKPREQCECSQVWN